MKVKYAKSVLDLYLGKLDQSLQASREALILYAQLGLLADLKLLPNIYRSRMLAFTQKKNPDSAYVYLDLALEKFHAINDSFNVAELCMSKSHHLRQEKKIDFSLTLAYKARDYVFLN